DSRERLRVGPRRARRQLIRIEPILRQCEGVEHVSVSCCESDCWINACKAEKDCCIESAGAMSITAAKFENRAALRSRKRSPTSRGCPAVDFANQLRSSCHGSSN